MAVRSRALAISARHAVDVAQLAMHHQDPFDRLLVAQAIAEPLRILTCDPLLEKYTGLVTRI